MKKILSERNIAALLFLVVIAVFAFAHEDSKKRQSNYNTLTPSISNGNTSASLINDKNKEEVKVKFTNYPLGK